MLDDGGDVGEMVDGEKDPKNGGGDGDGRDDRLVDHLKRSIL